MITVAEFHTVEQLRELRLLWTELWMRTKQASFFQSFDWFTLRHSHFGSDESVFVLVVSIAGKPFGILPFVKRKTWNGIVGDQRLTDAANGWAAFSGPIGPNPTATLAAVMRHFKNERRDWDVIDLHHVDVDGLDRGRTRNAMKTVGLRSGAVPSAHTAEVVMETDWNEYWASRPRDLHREYNQAEERLANFGDVRYARFRPNYESENPRWDLFSAFLRADHTSMFPDSQSRRPSLTKSQQTLLSEAHDAAVKQGAVDLNLLFVNNRPAASAYNYVRDGRVEGIRFGIAADATTDAATVLLGLMLRDSFDRGDAFYRFPFGDKSATTGWANHFQTSHRLTHYSPWKLRAQAARLADWLHDPHPESLRDPNTIHVPMPPVETPAAIPAAESREFAVVG